MRSGTRATLLFAITPLIVLLGRLSGGDASPSKELRPGRSVIQRDADVAVSQPGPYNGGGQSTGHAFFQDVPNPEIGFRKRVLHPGAAIGYHLHDGSEPGLGDEVYYIASGRGELTLDGKKQEIGPGTAILTRLGSSHGLRQLGTEDLVILMAWPESSAGK
jgi:quercetin dioxygenase-like cupin family protein